MRIKSLNWLLLLVVALALGACGGTDDGEEDVAEGTTPTETSKAVGAAPRAKADCAKVKGDAEGARVAYMPPATEFLKRAFAQKDVLKGIICHGMWLVAPAPELVRGRPVVAHNNLLGDVRNMGAIYVNEDVVVDGDLVTGRTGGHCHLFARRIIDILSDGDSA